MLVNHLPTDARRLKVLTAAGSCTAPEPKARGRTVRCHLGQKRSSRRSDHAGRQKRQTRTTTSGYPNADGPVTTNLRMKPGEIELSASRPRIRRAYAGP